MPVHLFTIKFVYFFKFYLGGTDPEVIMAKSKSQRGPPTLSFWHRNYFFNFSTLCI